MGSPLPLPSLPPQTSRQGHSSTLDSTWDRGSGQGGILVMKTSSPFLLHGLVLRQRDTPLSRQSSACGTCANNMFVVAR